MLSELFEPCSLITLWLSFAEAEFIFRAGIMYASVDDEEPQQLRNGMFSMSGSRDGFLGAVGRSIDLGGQTALALRLLLAVFSSKVASDGDRRFGDEFRAARKASEEIGAQLVLGDRPIEITLERAWNSLAWNEKFSLLTSVIGGITSAPTVSAESSKDSNDEDGTFQLYDRLSLTYPSLLQPLIHERDTYLSWSLKRSKAVNGSKSVVGVIGKGHMNGVIYALVSDLGDLRFRDLAGYKKSSGNEWINTLARSLIRDTVIGVILWALYEQIMTVSEMGIAP
uniref:TraB family protein n=1 Tax=Kalanchoe fedtschenkoi TaxID=63787 RepID=A0A7N0RD30_KALFE